MSGVPAGRTTKRCFGDRPQVHPCRAAEKTCCATQSCFACKPGFGCPCQTRSALRAEPLFFTLPKTSFGRTPCLRLDSGVGIE